jgi:hypothetical protein
MLHDLIVLGFIYVLVETHFEMRETKRRARMAEKEQEWLNIRYVPPQSPAPWQWQRPEHLKEASWWHRSPSSRPSNVS